MTGTNTLSGIALIAVTASISQASLVVQHLGANDPATEGWSFVSGGSADVTVGGITDDAGSGLDTWYVSDASDSDYGLYMNSFTTAQKMDLLANDWIATAKIRIGQGNYNLVNLIVPEPSSLGLLAGTSMLVMRRIRR